MKVEKIRLQKFLAERGVASRRKCEELIENGKVKVNGHTASLGDKVDPVRDFVTVSGKRIESKRTERLYIMLNKPRGFVTTMSDELGRRCVSELVEDAPGRVYAVGRLDKDSEGLLLFTDDGDFANMMMHPSRHVPKTYRLTVKPDFTDEHMLAFKEGIVIEGKKTAPAQAEIISRESGRVVVKVVLNEGRNRQIRKMCEAIGVEVARLKRVAIGNLKLGMLPCGKWRELTQQEVRGLISSAKNPVEANNSRG